MHIYTNLSGKEDIICHVQIFSSQFPIVLFSIVRMSYRIYFASLNAVTPDFAQVYGFIGSVFDSGASDHLKRLKMMDPIDVETVSQISVAELVLCVYDGAFTFKCNWVCGYYLLIEL